MKTAVKYLALFVAGMLLWSVLLRGYELARDNMPDFSENEQKTGCEYMVTCGA